MFHVVVGQFIIVKFCVQVLYNAWTVSYNFNSCVVFIYLAYYNFGFRKVATNILCFLTVKYVLSKFTFFPENIFI